MDDKGNSDNAYEQERHFKPTILSKNTEHEVYNTLADFSETVVKTTDVHKQGDFHSEYKKILG